MEKIFSAGWTQFFFKPVLTKYRPQLLTSILPANYSFFLSPYPFLPFSYVPAWATRRQERDRREPLWQYR